MSKLAVILLYLSVATPSFALNITARSGEHDGFTRVVFYLPDQARWTSTNIKDGIELFFHGQPVTLNTDEFYTRLQKDRVRRIFVDPNDHKIVLQFNCHCEAKQFTTDAGLLVFDIKASQNSPSENTKHSKPVLPLLFEKPSKKPDFFTSNFNDKIDLDLQQHPQLADKRTVLKDALTIASDAMILEKTEPSKALPLLVGSGSQPMLPNLAISDSIDSSLLAIDRNPPLNQEGERCPSNDELSLFDWAGHTPFHEQIAIARSNLVGEFDKVDPQAVLDLIKLYLAFGFGTEARYTIGAFQITQDREKYLAIADILDPKGPSKNTYFEEFLSCNTHAALWSILLLDPLPENSNLNLDAIAFAVMSLPQPVKSRLGALVAERVLEAGFSTLSETIIRHIQQTSSQKSLGQDLMFARLQRHAGQSDKAVAHLEAMLRSRPSVSPETLIEFIDLKIYLDQPIDRKFADLAGVLAWEYKDSEFGSHLQHYQIKALIMAGAYREALQHYKTGPKSHQFDNEFAQLMTSKSSDADFVKTAFFLLPASLDSALPQMAKRLVNLGFWRQAEQLLSRQQSEPLRNQIKILKAEIALERESPERALALLNGLSDPAALILKADALMATRQFDLAEQIFAGLKNTKRQRIAAWHSQNTGALRQLGNPALAELLELDSQKTGAGLPVLAQNRSLVDNSKQLRSVLQAALISAQNITD